MINFFRKTRKKLADNNQFLKYSRYAIGEIMLVVVGILIALQINTWNKENNTRLIEIKTLKEIRGNLYVDLAEIHSDISMMDSINYAGEAVINYLKRNNEPSGLFKYQVHISRIYPHFDPNRSGYSLLISKGIDIVSNDSLRESISLLYELNYPYYSKYENERVSLIASLLNPTISKYFSILWSDDNYFDGSAEISQNDYLKLIKDTSFINVMNLTIFQNKMVKNRAQRTVGKITNLITQIEEELTNKKN